MESKIAIDIDKSGMPQIRIDYKITNDLRDRLIGRFLDKMGIPADKSGFWAYCRLGLEAQANKERIHDEVVVFIEPMDDHILPPDLYESWERISDTFKATRQAFKN